MPYKFSNNNDGKFNKAPNKHNSDAPLNSSGGHKYKLVISAIRR